MENRKVKIRLRGREAEHAKACPLAIGHESNRDCLIMNVSEPEITSVTDLTDKSC